MSSHIRNTSKFLWLEVRVTKFSNLTIASLLQISSESFTTKPAHLSFVSSASKLRFCCESQLCYKYSTGTTKSAVPQFERFVLEFRCSLASNFRKLRRCKQKAPVCHLSKANRAERRHPWNTARHRAQ